MNTEPATAGTETAGNSSLYALTYICTSGTDTRTAYIPDRLGFYAEIEIALELVCIYFIQLSFLFQGAERKVQSFKNLTFSIE